jgi:sugar lactone lactonase YvrE
MMARRIGLLVCLVAVASVGLGIGAGVAAARGFPSVVALPDGFQPEGIAAGRGHTLFAGSLANGAVYRADARTGRGEILVPGVPGRVAVGLAYDRRTGYLFVAGGATGMGHVYDTRTGTEVASFALTPPGTFVNDVVVTKDGAYFTDSFQASLFVLPLSRRGDLPTGPVTLPLSGDWTQVAGFNANGIEATADGSALIVVNSTVGALYAVDPVSGRASTIDLGGASVSSGDGLLLDGRTLYVVRNFLNAIAVVELAPDLASGTVVDELVDPDFRIPTTIARTGKGLYAVNARFDVTPTPDTEYEIVRVDER